MALATECLELIFSNSELFRVVVVGPRESKWTKIQERKVKDFIRTSLVHELDIYGKNLVVVSGRCPVSVCDNCGKNGFSKTDDPIVGYVKCEFCGQLRKRRAGGVDIWVEEIVDKLGIKKEIYPAEVNQFPDKIVWKCLECKEIKEDGASAGAHDRLIHKGMIREVRLKGFRSRNIKMAKVCNILYCIVPYVHWDKEEKANRNNFCIHCEKPNHPTNGGCWTKKYADGIGKPTNLIVIE